DAASGDQPRKVLHFEERKLGCGEHHHIELFAGCGKAGVEGGEVIGTDGCALGNRAAMKGCRERWCLRGDTQQVEQGNRTKARERRAKMFELVGVGGRGHPADDRDVPVTVGGATDNAAERAPIGEVSRLVLDYKMASS